MQIISPISFYQVRSFDVGKSTEQFCEERGIRPQDINHREFPDSPTLQKGEMLILTASLKRRVI